MNKRMRPWPIVLLLVAFMVMLTACGGSSGSDSGTSASSNDSGASAQSGEAYEVGGGRVVTYTNSIGTEWVIITVPVTNTGDTNLYLSSGTMDIEDQDGHLIDSKSLVSVYPEVLQPGETAWYYEETMLDGSSGLELKVLPHVEVEKAKIDCVRYDVTDVTISDETYGGIKVTGRVENTTDEDESMPYVVVLMYDANGQLLGTALDIVDGLNAGEKKGFSASSLSSYKELKTSNIASYEVYAYPNKFQF